MNQDISLKFSVFVCHMFVQIWQKNFTIAQSACLPQLVLAKTLDASSNHICCDILNRKKWRGSGPNGAASWKDFSISLKNGVMKSFESPFKMFTDGKHLKAYEMACRGLALHMRFNAWQCLHRGSFRGRLKYNLLGFALLLGVEPGERQSPLWDTHFPSFRRRPIKQSKNKPLAIK